MSDVAAILQEVDGSIDEGLAMKILQLKVDDINTYLAALSYAFSLPKESVAAGIDETESVKACRRICKSLRISFVANCFKDVKELRLQDVMVRFRALAVPEYLMPSLLHAVSKSNEHHLIREKTKHKRPAKSCKVVGKMVAQQPQFVVSTTLSSEPAYIVLRSDFWNKT